MSEHKTKAKDGAISAGITRKLKDKKLRLATLTLIVIASLALAGLLLLHLPPVQNKILARVLSKINSSLSLQVTVKSFRWIPASSLSLVKFTVARNGTSILRVDRIVVNYGFRFRWPEFIKIKQVRLIAPKLYLEKNQNGNWNLPVPAKGNPLVETVTDNRGQELGKGKASLEYLLPRSWIVEEGNVTIEGTKANNSREEKYAFKNINAVFSCSLKKSDGIYRADFNLERASFYQTRPGLGLILASGKATLQKSKLDVTKMNINIGSCSVKLTGEVTLSPVFQPALALEVRNLAPSKVALFIPSWPLAKKLNASITMAGNAKSLSMVGAAHWGRSSLNCTGTVGITGSGQPGINMDVLFHEVNLVDFSFPVVSNLNGNLKFKLLGLDLSSANGSIRCQLENSSVDDKQIKVASLAAEIHKGLINLSTLEIKGEPGRVAASGYLDVLAGKRKPAPPTKNALALKGIISGLNLRPFSQDRKLPQTDLNFSFNLKAYGKNKTKDNNTPLWKQWNGSCLIKIGSSSLDNVHVAKGRFDASLEKGLLKLEKAELYTEKGYVALSGTLLLPGKVNLSYDTSIKDLSAISKVVPWRQVKGEVKSSGVIRGSLKSPGWEGSLYARDLSITGYAARVLKITGKSSLSLKTGERILDISALEFTAGSRKINEASLSLKQENDHLEAQGFIRFNEKQTRLEFSLESPDISAPDRTFLISSLTLADKASKWALEKGGVVKVSKGRFEAKGLEFKHLDEKVSFKGVLNRDETCRFELGLHNINIGKFGKLVGKPVPLAGKLNATFTMKGSFDAPVMHATGSIGSLKFDKANFRPLQFELNYEKPSLAWNIELSNTKGNVAKLYGHLDLDINLRKRKIVFPGNRVSGEIRGERVDLAVLKKIEPEFKEISGTLNINVNVSGTKDHPRIEGVASLENVKLKLEGWQHSFSEVNIFCRLQTRGIDVVRATGKWGEGKIHFSGWIPYPFGKSGLLNLVARLENVTLPIIYGVHSRVDAKLHIGGNRDTPDLTGKVKIRKAIVMLDELMSDSQSDIEVVDNPPKEEKAPSPSGIEDSLSNNLRMNLKIEAEPGHAWLNGKGINAELAGNLNLTKEPRKSITIQGKLNVIRGAYNMQGKIFHIVEGTVLFNGLSPPDPNLHVVCEYRVREVKIYATLKGSATRMQLDLSSEPPMEKVDILAYILYGHPASKLSAKEASSFGDEALALVGNKVARLLKEKILPDSPWVPDVLTYKSGTSEEEGGVVMIGKYITPDLFVDLEKGTSSKVGDQMKIEYKINKHFSIESQIGDEANSGVDIFWRYDFGQ